MNNCGSCRFWGRGQQKTHDYCYSDKVRGFSLGFSQMAYTYDECGEVFTAKTLLCKHFESK